LESFVFFLSFLTINKDKKKPSLDVEHHCYRIINLKKTNKLENTQKNVTSQIRFCRFSYFLLDFLHVFCFE